MPPIPPMPPPPPGIGGAGSFGSSATMASVVTRRAAWGSVIRFSSKKPLCHSRFLSNYLCKSTGNNFRRTGNFLTETGKFPAAKELGLKSTSERNGGIPRHEQNRQRAHSLRSQDEYPFDVCSRRRARMEDGVTTFPKLRPGIGAVDVDDDIGRIEQNNQVLCE